MELQFQRFWKMYNAMPIIKLELLTEADLILRTCLNTGETEDVWEVLEKAYQKIPRIRPLEERKRDAKNARLQFKQMNRKIRQQKKEVEEKRRKQK